MSRRRLGSLTTGAVNGMGHQDDGRLGASIHTVNLKKSTRLRTVAVVATIASSAATSEARIVNGFERPGMVKDPSIKHRGYEVVARFCTSRTNRTVLLRWWGDGLRNLVSAT